MGKRRTVVEEDVQNPIVLYVPSNINPHKEMVSGLVEDIHAIMNGVPPKAHKRTKRDILKNISGLVDGVLTRLKEDRTEWALAHAYESLEPEEKKVFDEYNKSVDFMQTIINSRRAKHSSRSMMDLAPITVYQFITGSETQPVAGYYWDRPGVEANELWEKFFLRIEGTPYYSMHYMENVTILKDLVAKCEVALFGETLPAEQEEILGHATDLTNRAKERLDKYKLE